MLGLMEVAIEIVLAESAVVAVPATIALAPVIAVVAVVGGVGFLVYSIVEGLVYG